MKASVIALGLLAIGLAQCSGDRGLFVGDERDAGDGGDTNETGGSGNATGGNATGGNAGTASGSAGTENSGGTATRGGSGSGAEGGEGADPGTGGSSTGGVEQGGSDTGGLAGDPTRGGSAGSGAQAGSGTAAQGGMNTGGRAGASNGGAGGRPTNDECTAFSREYLERLAAAQQCTPVSTTTECSLVMDDDLLCGCPTYVNPARDADIARMRELIEKARGCTRICPAIACREVKRGVCSSDAILPAKGRCTGAP